MPRRVTMEAVFSAPELVDQVICGSFEKCARVVAKLRMVCKFLLDVFEVKKWTRTRTGPAGLYNATVYNVWNFSGRGPYNVPAAVNNYLARAGLDGWRSNAGDHSNVFHAEIEDGKIREVFGFYLTADEFVAVNRLFGIKSDSYGLLLKLPSVTNSYNADIRVGKQHGIKVLFGRDSYKMHRVYDNVHLYSVFYLFYGKIHGCTVDLGTYSNLVRLEKLVW